MREKAIEKLEAARASAKKSGYEPVIDFLIKRCQESESFAEDIAQDHKTWDKCSTYIMDAARNHLNGHSGCVEDSRVFEWAEDYFHLDDKAQEEKKAKQKEESDKKAKERAAQRAKEDEEKKAKAEAEKAKKKEEAAAKKAAEKAKKKEVEGQMDLFSMFGEEMNG